MKVKKKIAFIKPRLGLLILVMGNRLILQLSICISKSFNIYIYIYYINIYINTYVYIYIHIYIAYAINPTGKSGKNYNQKEKKYLIDYALEKMQVRINKSKEPLCISLDI